MSDLEKIRALIEGQGKTFGTVIGGLDNRIDDLAKTMTRLRLGGLAGPTESPDESAAAASFYSLVCKGQVTDGAADIESYREYCGAFNAYVRRGKDAISPDVHAALSVGSDPDGGYWVPPTVSTEIQKRMFDTSPIRQLADIVPIGTDRLEFPIDSNDLASGGWVGESESRPETGTPKIGKQSIPVHEQYAQPKATQNLLDDTTFGVGEWLTDKISGKLGRDENTAFVVGDGVAAPRGFLSYGSAATTEEDAARSWGVLQYVPTGLSAGFPKVSGTTIADDAGPLIDLTFKLKAEYLADASWVMSRFTAAVVRKMKDENGRLIWLDSLTDGGRPLLLGFPVIFAEDMPAIAANSLSIAFGNFRRGYRIVDRQGLRLLRDPFTEKGFVKFYATKRVGGDVVDFDAIKLLKFAAN